MVRLLLRGAAIAFAASACWSCGSDPNSTQPGPGRDGGAMGGPLPDAGADTGPAADDAEGGMDASDGAVADALAEVDGASTALTLTSSAFTNMDDINVMSGCGTTMSPPLAWTPGPSGTQSYGLVLTDQSGFYYWAIWDIPATTMSLPQGIENAAMPAVPAGSEQITPGQYMSTLPGYTGPCPTGLEVPVTFALYALSVATLPGVTPGSTGAAVFAAIQANALASAKLIARATNPRL
jgi:Raf kinase inhibitor-like YbhB/YbcL family protein